MIDDISGFNLSDDLGEVHALDDAKRWKLEAGVAGEVLVTLSPEGVEETFQARVFWQDRYPQDAPSLKFRDPATGRLDMPSAWPRVRGFRPASLDACVNWCSEGLAIHPEWKNDPAFRWDPRGNVLLKVLRILQSELDSHFDGRHSE